MRVKNDSKKLEIALISRAALFLIFQMWKSRVNLCRYNKYIWFATFILWILNFHFWPKVDTGQQSNDNLTLVWLELSYSALLSIWIREKLVSRLLKTIHRLRNCFPLGLNTVRVFVTILLIWAWFLSCSGLRHS